MKEEEWSDGGSFWSVITALNSSPRPQDANANGVYISGYLLFMALRQNGTSTKIVVIKRTQMARLFYIEGFFFFKTCPLFCKNWIVFRGVTPICTNWASGPLTSMELLHQPRIWLDTITLWTHRENHPPWTKQAILGKVPGCWYARATTRTPVSARDHIASQPWLIPLLWQDFVRASLCFSMAQGLNFISIKLMYILVIISAWGLVPTKLHQ